MSDQIIKDWLSSDPIEFNRMDTHSFEGAGIRFLEDNNGDEDALREELEQCEAEKTQLETENAELITENGLLNNILDGKCWSATGVETRSSGVCGNSVSTATSLLCYVGIDGSNRYTFETTITRVQEGGNGYTCGQRVTIGIKSQSTSFTVQTDNAGVSTLTVPTNQPAATWTVFYSWTASGGVSINQEPIGQIYLPQGGVEPTFYPQNTATN